MFEFLRQLTSGITEAWGRLSVNARVQIGASAVLSLLLLIGAMYMGTRPQLTRAYTGLDLAESSDIEIYLTDQGIPHRLRDGGRSIDISTKDIPAARAYLAGQGIPKSQGVSPDFGIFDTRSMMSSKFLDDVAFMRGLNGTLQDQLNDFDFVRNSTVMIREAKESLFRDYQKPSEAVVTLELAGGPLSAMQVKSVVHTISSFGGGNLSTNNITVVTTAGVPIHTPITDEYASMANSRLELQISRETQREKKIVSDFDELGRKAIINVSVLADWSTSDEHATTYDPKGKVLVASSLNTTESTTGDASAVDGGAPGVTANIAGAESDGGTITKSETKDQLDNFELSSKVTSTSKEPGRVKNYMIAAIIEGDYETDENGERTYIGLTDDQIAAFEKQILYSVGIGEGDSEITIMDQPFEVNPLAASPVAAGATIFRNPQLWQAVQGFLILLSFILLRVFIRRAMVLPAVEVEEAIELPTMSEEERKSTEIASEIERLSQEEPETVAALLRTWMAEDD